MAAMGMMNEGYFVGRKELISWIQQNFQPNFAKIEDLASGAVYCQIVDSIYPGAVPMSKVKMGGKTEVDFIHNFKILQTAFSKKKIDRFIDVDKLTKKSFQFNMEFLQFMKAYWDLHAPNGAGPIEGNALVEAGSNEPPSAEKPARKPAAEPKPERAMGGGAKRAPARAGGAGGAAGASAAAGRAAGGAGAAAGQQQQELAMEVSELKLSVENLERERDFYYSKLREVEVLCQANEGASVPFLQSVLDILYKTDDADEFVTPDEAQEVA